MQCMIRSAGALPPQSRRKENDIMRKPRRLSARHSPGQGTGLFALQPLKAGERLIEYKGEVTSWRREAARQRSNAGQLRHNLAALQALPEHHPG